MRGVSAAFEHQTATAEARQNAIIAASVTRSAEHAWLDVPALRLSAAAAVAKGARNADLVGADALSENIDQKYGRDDASEADTNVPRSLIAANGEAPWEPSLTSGLTQHREISACEGGVRGLERRHTCNIRERRLQTYLRHQKSTRRFLTKPASSKTIHTLERWDTAPVPLERLRRKGQRRADGRQEDPLKRWSARGSHLDRASRVNPLANSIAT